VERVIGEGGKEIGVELLANQSHAGGEGFGGRWEKEVEEEEKENNSQAGGNRNTR